MAVVQSFPGAPYLSIMRILLPAGSIFLVSRFATDLLALLAMDASAATSSR